MDKPFRWHIHKTEQLGQLAEGVSVDAYVGFDVDLRQAAARLLSACAKIYGKTDAVEHARIVFVGRSPENFFDYLSGAFLNEAWHESLCLLNVSLRMAHTHQLQSEYPGAEEALKRHFEALNLSPASLIHAPKPITFVDLVYSGRTFRLLFEFMHRWAKIQVQDVPAVLRKLRFVGITERTKTSPNTWRWQQHAEWTKQLPKSAICNVSIPRRMWNYMGNHQSKTSRWNPPWRWQEPKMFKAQHTECQLQALRLAMEIFEQAQTREERLALKRCMGNTHGVKYGWFRDLMTSLS